MWGFRMIAEAASRIWEPRRWDGNGPKPTSIQPPELLNDLESPIEVQQGGGDWQVLYPCSRTDTPFGFREPKRGATAECGSRLVKLQCACGRPQMWEPSWKWIPKSCYLHHRISSNSVKRPLRGTTSFWPLPSASPSPVGSS